MTGIGIVTLVYRNSVSTVVVYVRVEKERVLGGEGVEGAGYRFGGGLVRRFHQEVRGETSFSEIGKGLVEVPFLEILLQVLLVVVDYVHVEVVLVIDELLHRVVYLVVFVQLLV